MTDPYITCEIKEARVYADSFEDLQNFVHAIRMESAGQIASLQHAVDAKREVAAKLEAELKDFRETAVYGPQLHAEKTAAMEARDRALEENEQLRAQLERERESRNDLDKTRRALAAKVRSLEEANEHLAGTVLEQRRILDRHERRGVKGARRR